MRVVIHAGNPAVAEIAAVAAAVVGIAAARVPEDDSGGPAWARAARLEAVGQAPFTSAADARHPRTPHPRN